MPSKFNKSKYMINSFENRQYKRDTRDYLESNAIIMSDKKGWLTVAEKRKPIRRKSNKKRK